MGKLINKIKAIAKILVGVIVASFLGSLITLFVVIITGAGALGLALGIVVMTGAAALGAVIGSRWAKNNITDYENAKKISIWSALLFLVTNLLILPPAISCLLLSGRRKPIFGYRRLKLLLNRL